MFHTYRKASVIVAIVLCLFSTVFAYSGGSGEPNNPYQIATVSDWNDLMNTSSDWGKYFIMTANVNLQGVPLTPVGNSTNKFTGVFDGNDHIISNVVISQSSSYYVGLFGYSNGQIRNLGVEDVNMTGDHSVGGLVGYNYGSINDCYSTGSVSGNYYVGGLVGLNHYGTISNCYAAGNVSGNSLIIYVGGIGGLVGCNHEYGTISNCYSTGTVTAADDMAVGGLVGHNWSTITNCYSTGSVSGNLDVGGLVGISYDTISNCYSTGAVSGSSHVGGLVGYARGTISNCNSTGAITGGDSSGGLVGYSEQGTITNCYSTGSVSGDTGVGGLVGYIYDGSVVGSFWDVNTSGQMTSAGGEGKTTVEMQDINTYLNAGWDFINETANGTCNYWQMPAGGGYPVLSTFNGYIPPEPSGSGTEDDPYVITDANGLGTIWYRPYAHYVLANDINLAGIQWSIAVAPIFGGVLDGNGFCIKNLSIYGANNLGLFGRISSGGSVKNLGLENCAVSGVSDSWYIGGLVGENYGGSISNCYSTGEVSGSNHIGGLVGSNSGGSISNCYSTGAVSGSSYCVGGLVGRNWYGSISNCYSTGAVSGNSYIGGLVGENHYSSISNCFSMGSVSGDSYVGGLVGYLNNGSISNCYSTGAVSGASGSNYTGGLVGYNVYGSIENCYSIGPVSGDSRVGGLCGSNGDVGPHSGGGPIKNCYSTGTVSGSNNVGGLCGYNYEGTYSVCYFLDTAGPDNGLGTPLTDEQMQDQASFISWDFSYNDGDEADWFIQIDEYPILTWQISPADIYTDGRNNFRDFAIFAQYWMREDCAIYNYYCDWADMNFDGSVDIDDLIELMSYWLQSGIYN